MGSVAGNGLLTKPGGKSQVAYEYNYCRAGDKQAAAAWQVCAAIIVAARRLPVAGAPRQCLPGVFISSHLRAASVCNVAQVRGITRALRPAASSRRADAAESARHDCCCTSEPAGRPGERQYGSGGVQCERVRRTVTMRSQPDPAPRIKRDASQSSSSAQYLRPN